MALMAQKYPALTADGVEAALVGSAVTLAPGCRTVMTPYAYTEAFYWGDDAPGA